MPHSKASLCTGVRISKNGLPDPARLLDSEASIEPNRTGSGLHAPRSCFLSTLPAAGCGGHAVGWRRAARAHCSRASPRRVRCHWPSAGPIRSTAPERGGKRTAEGNPRYELLHGLAMSRWSCCRPVTSQGTVTVPRARMLATFRNRHGVVAAVEPFDGDAARWREDDRYLRNCAAHSIPAPVQHDAPCARPRHFARSRYRGRVNPSARRRARSNV